MIILEKLSSQGVHRIEITVGERLVEHLEYLNNKVCGSGKALASNQDQLITGMLKDFASTGYIKVDKVNTLKYNESMKFDLIKMQFPQFRKEYPSVYLSNFPWSHFEIEVYLEDFVIEGDLDLTKVPSLSEPYGKVFLKNLIVKGNIFSSDLDVDIFLRVVGDLNAYSIVAGGPQVYVDGITKLRDVFVDDVQEKDYKFHNISAPLYIQTYDVYIASHHFTTASFNYCFYFDEGLKIDEKSEAEKSCYKLPMHLRGNNQTWVNNNKLFSMQEIEAHLTYKPIIDILLKRLGDFDDKETLVNFSFDNVMNGK